MATSQAVAAATITGPKMSAMRGAASFPFSPRNLILSSSPSFSPRLAFLSPRVPRLAMRSKRIAMDKRSDVMPRRRHGGVVAVASAAGSPEFGAGEIDNPYEILGISRLDGFDRVKMVYKRKRKDAESSCDREYLLKLERAYDMLMMDQLLNQKKGVTYTLSQVSKDIRYADYQPIVPWGPRYSRSTVKDLRINMAISAAFIMCISTLGHADWKPLQFLCFAYFYRILEKLKVTEPAIAPIYNEYGEVKGRGIHMVRRVLRSLGLVLGSILAASLGYTGLANFSQFLGEYIPSVVYNFQKGHYYKWMLLFQWKTSHGSLQNESWCCFQLSYAVFRNSKTYSQYLIPGVDCDYSFIHSALHLSFILPIAIGAGLEKTCLINDTSLSTSDLENFAGRDQMLLSNDWRK